MLLLAGGRDSPRLDGAIARATLGVQKAEEFLERLRVRAIADERFFTLGGDELVVLEFFQVMGERRSGDAGFGLDVADDEAVGMRGEQESDDAQPRFRAQG